MQALPAVKAICSELLLMESISIFGHVLEEDLRDVARDMQYEQAMRIDPREPFICYLGHRNCYAMHNDERRENGDEEVPF